MPNGNTLATTILFVFDNHSPSYIKYDGLKLLEIVKVDDEDDVNPPPFSLLHFDLHTYSGLLASEDTIRVIKVRYGEDEIVFDNNVESVILQQFSDYLRDKNPDIMGDYDNGKVLRYLMARAEKMGFDLQPGSVVAIEKRHTLTSLGLQD